MPLLDAVFPTEAKLPECVRELLAALYPTVRWDHVTFHDELPGYLQGFTDIAVTLPDPLSLRHIRIFVARKHWNPASLEGIGILVHESYHVLQYQEGWGGFGLGPARAFPLKYLTAAIVRGEGGGRQNRYEKIAYEHEELFRKACKALQLCPCCSGAPGTDRAAVDELLKRHPELVKRSARD
jgi:hypothetical protein